MICFMLGNRVCLFIQTNSKRGFFMTDNFDMDDISLDGISLDDLTSLPDLPESANDWKRKHHEQDDQDSIDISGLDMDSLNTELPETERAPIREPAFLSSKAAAEEAAARAEEAKSEPKPAPAPIPAKPSIPSGLPAGYVPPVGGINVQKKSVSVPNAAGRINVEKKPASVQSAAGQIDLEKKPAPTASSGGISIEKKPVSVPNAGAAGGISIQKKSVTTPASSGGYVPPTVNPIGSAPQPVKANAAPVTTVKKSEVENLANAIPRQTPAESKDISDVKPPVISGMDDIPMPKLSDMDGTEAKPKAAPVNAAPKPSNSYAANKPQAAAPAPAQHLSAAEQRRQDKLNAGFDDQPIRVSQLSHQAMVDAQMQEWENQRRKDYEDGRTIVMIIAIIYGILGFCNFLGDISVMQGIFLAIDVIIALQLFKGNYKVRVWYIVFAILGAIGNGLAIMSLLGISSYVNQQDETLLAESGLTPYIILAVVIGMISTIYNIVTSVLLMCNKKVRVYFEHT